MCHTPTGYRRGAHLPFSGHEPLGGNTTIVSDAWPVRRPEPHTILLANPIMCGIGLCCREKFWEWAEPEPENAEFPL